jgi:hypothetical protein
MASGSFNVALGREVEFHNRVNNNDPTNAALVLVVLSSTGLEIDAVLQDYDTLSALLAGASNEVTNVGYARIYLDDADLIAYTVDDTNDEIRLPLANQTFTSIVAGNSWRKLLICYDAIESSGGDDDVIPIKHFDILSTVTGQAIVPNGGDIIFSFPEGYHVAT